MTCFKMRFWQKSKFIWQSVLGIIGAGEGWFCLKIECYVCIVVQSTQSNCQVFWDHIFGPTIKCTWLVLMKQKTIKDRLLSRDHGNCRMSPDIKLDGAVNIICNVSNNWRKCLRMSSTYGECNNRNLHVHFKSSQYFCDTWLQLHTCLNFCIHDIY